MAVIVSTSRTWPGSSDLLKKRVRPRDMSRGATRTDSAKTGHGSENMTSKKQEWEGSFEEYKVMNNKEISIKSGESLLIIIPFDTNNNLNISCSQKKLHLLPLQPLKL